MVFRFFMHGDAAADYGIRESMKLPHLISHQYQDSRIAVARKV